MTPVDGDLDYAEGPFIGYRGHDAGRAPAPAFWFGHGLGYATWDYAHASVLPAARRARRLGHGDEQRPTAPAARSCRSTTSPPAATSPSGWSAGRPSRPSPVSRSRAEIRTDARMWRRWDSQASAWAALGPGGRLLVARGLGDVRASLDLP